MDTPFERKNRGSAAPNTRTRESANPVTRSTTKRNRGSSQKGTESPWQKKPLRLKKRGLDELKVSGKAFSQTVTPRALEAKLNSIANSDLVFRSFCNLFRLKA